MFENFDWSKLGGTPEEIEKMKEQFQNMKKQKINPEKEQSFNDTKES